MFDADNLLIRMYTVAENVDKTIGLVSSAGRILYVVADQISKFFGDMDSNSLEYYMHSQSDCYELKSFLKSLASYSLTRVLSSSTLLVRSR